MYDSVRSYTSIEYITVVFVWLCRVNAVTGFTKRTKDITCRTLVFLAQILKIFRPLMFHFSPIFRSFWTPWLFRCPYLKTERPCYFHNCRLWRYFLFCLVVLGFRILQCLISVRTWNIVYCAKTGSPFQTFLIVKNFSKMQPSRFSILSW